MTAVSLVIKRFSWAARLSAPCARFSERDRVWCIDFIFVLYFIGIILANVCNMLLKSKSGCLWPSIEIRISWSWRSFWNQKGHNKNLSCLPDESFRTSCHTYILPISSIWLSEMVNEAKKPMPLSWWKKKNLKRHAAPRHPIKPLESWKQKNWDHQNAELLFRNDYIFRKHSAWLPSNEKKLDFFSQNPSAWLQVEVVQRTTSWFFSLFWYSLHIPAASSCYTTPPTHQRRLRIGTSWPKALIVLAPLMESAKWLMPGEREVPKVAWMAGRR